MPGSRNSKNSRRSNRPVTSAGLVSTTVCFLACLLVTAGAVAYFHRTGATLYSGDAEAHLNIARRVVDSRMPGWVQLGTTWLPLPHLLMLPLVRDLELWRTGLAGAIPSAVCMALAGTFLFAAMVRIFGSRVAGATAAAVFLLNPNTLYLSAIPMTEPLLFACLFGLLYFSVRFGDTQGWGALAGCGIAAFAGTLTRYEMWFLLPFAAAYIFFTGQRKSRIAAVVFCLIAGAGPLLWFWHNWWYFEDALYFYRGPWSAKVIQGNAAYPGRGDWFLSLRYFFEASRWIAGLPALVLAAVGALYSASRSRARWALLLLILPGAFYVWSIHSSGTPIFVPNLEPHGWYNIRYAMASLPLVALGAAALVSLTISTAARWRNVAVVVILMLVFAPFAIQWNTHSIIWQEAEMNSRGRRAYTEQAVNFLRRAAGPNETYFTSFNDMTAIYRTLGIPLRLTLTGDINPQFLMVQSRPDLFLWEDWAIVMGGDTVQGIIDKARLHGPRFDLSEQIFVKGQPVIEIYHRTYDHPVR